VSARPDRPRALPDTAPEAALLVLSLAVVVGFDRLFLDGPWVAPLAWAVVLAHVVAATVRRIGGGPAAGALAVAVATTLLATHQLFPGTTWWGLPTRDTWDAAGRALDVAATLWPDVRAPAEAVPGFVLVAMVGLAAGALLADDLYGRRGSIVAALVPAGTAFVVASLLGGDDGRVRSTVLVLAAGLGVVLVGRLRDQRAGQWLPGDAGRGPRALVRSGAAVAGIAVLAGALVGPVLPGADDDPWWTWRGRGTGARITISPLVDIQSRLVQQSNRVAFVVESDARSYWRLTALDTFDGRIWRSSGSFAGADGPLPATGTTGSDATVATQRFEIVDLEAIWAPAAFEPRLVRPGDARLSYDPGSATLIVDDADLSDGIRYEVTSTLPRFDPAVLRADEAAPPARITERHLQLPADFSPAIAALAIEVTAGAATPYDAVRTLQDWFRDSFTYSLQVPAGHDGDLLERFLFDTRSGYCEQFAGAFAAMARSLGIPARVAVGFTPGEATAGPDGRVRYTVRGENAHAWPEVWLGSTGWVPFEPTPGRGAPGAAQWTEVAEAQEGQTEPTVTPTTVPTDRPTTPTTAPDIDFGAFDDGGAGDLATSIGGGDTPGAARWLVGVLVVVPAVLLLAAGTTMAAHRARRARRWRTATDPSTRARAAWDEAIEELASIELTPAPSETDLEFARRVGPELGDDRVALGELAAAATTARYRPAGLDEQRGAATGPALARVTTEVRRRRTRRQWVAATVDPRPLLPRRRRNRQVSRRA